MPVQPIKFKEHESKELIEFENELDRECVCQILKNQNYSPEKPQLLLGIDWDPKDRTQGSICAGYYIGLKWIRENESFVAVMPKIDNLDFMTMFARCFDSSVADLRGQLENESNKKEIYSIDFESPAIETNAVNFEITPLLVIHFLKLVSAIVAKGLKMDYVIKEDTFHGKVKGKLLVGRTVRRFINSGRQDLLDCRYQDYSVDNTDNRIIKKALQFCQRYITGHRSLETEILPMIAENLSYFAEVSDNIPTQVIKQHKVNPLFKEYREALTTAKMIIQRFGYSLNNVEADIDKKSMPPFWIDMPILFELYTYALLKERYGDQVKYHITDSHHSTDSQYRNELDFAKLDEQLIIDTKYIPSWAEYTKEENVRQLSGYARNTEIRRKIMGNSADETTILPCLILYPTEQVIPLDSVMPEAGLLTGAEALQEYVKFYRRPVPVPLKKDSPIPAGSAQ